MKRHAILLLLFLSVPADAAFAGGSATYWRPYGRRFAVVVMAGNVVGREPHYGWYWADTWGMYRELIDREGFPAEDVYFLSYGPKADENAQAVHATSTTENVRKVLRLVAQRSGPDDLVYLYWVDHGGPQTFETFDGHLEHRELGRLIQAIRCRVFVGAFNPCNSGAVIDDIRSERAVICTSVLPEEGNSWGWASEWRFALDGGDDKSRSDANRDGRISVAEAYAWVAAKANRAGEHPLIDDNGDGRPGRLDQGSFDPADPGKDGHLARRFSLNAWLDDLPVCPRFEEFRLEGHPVPGEEDRAALAAFLGKRISLTEGSLPALVFCHSEERAGRCRSAEERLFRLPAARKAAVTASAIPCFRVDVSGLTAAGSPLLHAGSVPAVVLLDGNGSISAVVRGRMLKDAVVAKEIRAVLDEEERTAAVSRVKAATPVLRELAGTGKKIEAARKDLRRLADRGDRAAVDKVSRSLRGLEAEYAGCVERLREILAE